jgi:hypothetical protein
MAPIPGICLGISGKDIQQTPVVVEVFSAILNRNASGYIPLSDDYR